VGDRERDAVAMRTCGERIARAAVRPRQLAHLPCM
jgi:hypothetical protein